MCSNTTVFVVPTTITQNNSIIQPLQQTRTISIKSTSSETIREEDNNAALRQASFAVASLQHMQLLRRVERRFATGTSTSQHSSLYYFCSSFVKFVCQFCLEEFRRHTTFFSQRQRLNAKAGHWHATMASAAVVVALHPRCRIPFKKFKFRRILKYKREPSTPPPPFACCHCYLTSSELKLVED